MATAFGGRTSSAPTRTPTTASPQTIRVVDRVSRLVTQDPQAGLSGPALDLRLALANLEGAEAAVGTASGMAGILSICMALLSAGDHVVCSRDVFGTTTNLFGKYLAKGENGWHHSVAFTLQNFHEPIMIKAKNAQILQDNCLSCHGNLVNEMVMGATRDPNAVRCVHCHADVGHGPTAGLGAPADY